MRGFVADVLRMCLGWMLPMSLEYLVQDLKGWPKSSCGEGAVRRVYKTTVKDVRGGMSPSWGLRGTPEGE